MLAADTAYTVMLTVLYGAYGYYDLTDSDNEDPHTAAGWTIDDAYQHKNSNDEWHDNTAHRTLRLAIRGTAQTTTTHTDTTTDTDTPQQNPPNTAATGAPTISGTAQVGETLTASTDDIADADGLAGVSYAYQWTRNDGAGDADIDGATASAYTLTAADVGKTVKVRVGFADDAGNAESLTSAVTAEVTQPLTASAHDTPVSHDGSAQFAFELRFSEDLSLSYRTLRDDAFDVTGAEIVGARRLRRGSNTRWEITVAPHGNADITITLPATADCTAQGAICAADGRKLSDGPTVTVAGPPTGTPPPGVAPPAAAPLTAVASRVPASHDGTTPFAFELRFSEKPTDSFSYTTLRHHAFTVTGGRIGRARRLTPGANTAWQITVQPNGNTAVTVTLPATSDCTAQGAICTDNAKKLSAPTTVTVPGPNTQP